MSTFIIWSDLTKAEQDKKLEEILAVAALDDFILYQGANQMDQTWYRVIEKEGKKDLKWTYVPYDDEDCRNTSF